MSNVAELLQVVAVLRHPEDGCPWDREQTLASIASFTQEEVYELIEAIESNDMEATSDELGDLLFHIVFYAQIGKEQGQFDFETIVSRACEKLTRRHPHIFADKKHKTIAAVRQNREQIKQRERLEKSREAGTQTHYLDGISQAQPALLRAAKLQKRAAAVGFDWPEAHAVLEKVAEELAELRAELQGENNKNRLAEEFGDLIFAVIHCAHHLEIDPEQALRAANRKFEKRFNYIEDQLKSQQRDLQSASLESMESLWQEAKAKKK